MFESQNGLTIRTFKNCFTSTYFDEATTSKPISNTKPLIVKNNNAGLSRLHDGAQPITRFERSAIQLIGIDIPVIDGLIRPGIPALRVSIAGYSRRLKWIDGYTFLREPVHFKGKRQFRNFVAIIRSHRVFGRCLGTRNHGHGGYELRCGSAVREHKPVYDQCREAHAQDDRISFVPASQHLAINRFPIPPR
jgi:hypothetical protein